jgi:chromosome segregation ATPase
MTSRPPHEPVQRLAAELIRSLASWVEDLDEIFIHMSEEKQSLQDLLAAMQAERARADGVARQVDEARASLEKTLQRVNGEIDRALDRLAGDRALADAAVAGHSIHRDDMTGARARSDSAKTGTQAPIDRLEQMHRELEALVGGLRGIVSEETPADSAPAEASTPPQLATEPLHAEPARPEPIRDH